MDTRFNAWDARSLYIADSLMTDEKEVLKYELDLMGLIETLSVILKFL
jgi:hypothetical protein